MTDQQRFDSLGCYGREGIETPNLDRLAAEGALFENCYVNNPICTPSRASLFTGKHLPGHGVYRLNDHLPTSETMFTKHLQDVGYPTALVGKLHVSAAVFERDHRNEKDGFDVYDWCHEPALFLDGEFNAYAKWLKKNHGDFYERLLKEGRGLRNVPAETHATRWTAERIVELLRNRDADKPFCHVMSIFDPHNPYTDYPAETRNLIDAANVGVADFRENESHDGKPSGIVREHQRGYMGSFHDYSPEDIREMRIGYFASVKFIDQEIGKVLDELDRQGLTESTLVIFVSDHGDMLGDHELLAKGAFFYDPCVKVPLIIRHPGRVPAGVRVDALVQPHDLAATILAAAGFTGAELEAIMPASMDLTALVNGAVTGRDHAVCAYRGTGICDSKGYFTPPIHATMIRNERFKLNAYHAPDCGGMEGELFDMLDDPGEKKNLWSDAAHTEEKTRLLAALTNWLVVEDLRANGSRGGESASVSSSLLRSDGGNK